MLSSLPVHFLSSLHSVFSSVTFLNLYITSSKTLQLLNWLCALPIIITSTRSSDTVRNVVQTDNKRKGGEKARQLVEPQTNIWRLKPTHSHMVCLHSPVPIAPNKAITIGEKAFPISFSPLFFFFVRNNISKC